MKSLIEMFMGKGKENEQIARANQEFTGKSDRDAAERMLTTLDRGDIMPGNWRHFGGRNERGGMKAEYSRPWDLPPQQFSDMISYQEGLSDSDMSSLNKDYEVLHGNAHGNIDKAIQQSALQQVYNQDSPKWSSSTDNNEVNPGGPMNGDY